MKYEDLTHEHVLALAILGQKSLKYLVGDINIFPTADEYLSGRTKKKAMGLVDETIVFDEIGLIEYGGDTLFLSSPSYYIVSYQTLVRHKSSRLERKSVDFNYKYRYRL